MGRFESHYVRSLHDKEQLSAADVGSECSAASTRRRGRVTIKYSVVVGDVLPEVLDDSVS
jgi:hypothetical protein